MSIAENLERVRESIRAACRRCGRAETEVELMAVSKVHPAAALREAFGCGQRLFGESRVQEWQEKRDALKDLLAGEDAARVHLIGPLQSNKTGRAAELFDAVDAVDSLRVATRLNAAAQEHGRVLPVLVEVKLSHEEAKHGVAPGELPRLLEALGGLAHLRPAGLMTVPPWSEDAEAARPYFRELRRLRDGSAREWPALSGLSMGMSNDFAVAIEEGSTCVRVGTAIFGRRPRATAA